MKFRVCSMIIIFAFLLSISYVFAGIPRMINYQGMLTDNLGSPLNGSYDLTFKIYGSLSSSDSLWTEHHLGVLVQGGLFNVLLGSTTPMPSTLFDDTVRYLGIKVGSDSELPRIRLTSVGYSFRSLRSDTASYALAGTGGGSNTWTFRITPTADTTLITGGRWGIARYGNELFGNADSTHVNFGVVCTTGTSGQNYKYCTVSGGIRNKATYDYSTVGGGAFNTASGEHATVGGGVFNIASNSYATIGGGYLNAAKGVHSTIGGGHSDTASMGYATIGGGLTNTASGGYSTVGGGQINKATADWSIIGGGHADTTKAVYGGVFSGYSNLAGDEATDTAAFVGGGYENTAKAKYATVCGGDSNTVSGPYAIVGGGYRNTANNLYATVGGGYINTAPGERATVGGGSNNNASGDGATVGGGYQNTASGFASTVSGGEKNFVAGDRAAILGGYADTITNTADYSYLFGIKSKLTQDSTFMVDMPHIRFGKESGGYEFPTSDGTSGQVMATNGSGQLSWANISSSGGGWTDAGTKIYLTTSTDTVGIGTNTPHRKVQITEDVNGLSCPFKLENPNNNIGTGVSTGIIFSAGGSGNARGKGGLVYELTDTWNRGKFHFLQDPNLNADNPTISDAVMTIQNDGKVGIGTTSPSSKLQVVGDLRVTDKANIGPNNSNAGTNAFVAGANNVASGNYSTVGGGNSDTTKALYGGVFSGYSNLAGDAPEDTAAFVGGGYNNSATGKYSTVSGGWNNTASGYTSTVDGGYQNTASGWRSTVVAGRQNTSNGDASTIIGGAENSNSGTYSIILGVQDTLTAAAEYSMAFGGLVYLNTGYRVAFFDATWSGRLAINRDDHDPGGIGYPIHVGTNTSNGNGAFLSAAGVWTNASSRTFKENFQTLDGNYILQQISNLPVETWNYKGTKEKHIGPCSEDFANSFDVGSVRENGTRENKYLSAGDVAGVALAGVKELTRENQELRLIIEELKQRITEMEKKKR